MQPIVILIQGLPDYWTIWRSILIISANNQMTYCIISSRANYSFYKNIYGQSSHLQAIDNHINELKILPLEKRDRSTVC